MNTIKLTSLFALVSCLAAGMPLFALGCSSETNGGGDDDDDGEDEDGNEDEDGAGGSTSSRSSAGGSENGPAVTSATNGSTGASTPNPSGGPECTGDELQCNGADIDVCEGGSFETYSCDAGCEEYGFSSDSCSGGQCQCDGAPTDASCLDGVGAFCACGDWAGSPCSDSDYVDYYVACHQGDSQIECFGYYVSGNQVDCEAAVSGCL